MDEVAEVTRIADAAEAADGASPLDEAARIALADGGDGFKAFTGGTGKYFGGLDINAFADYLKANSPYTPGPLDRITKLG